MSERPPILCVDDDHLILEGMRDNLRRHFVVSVESSPLEAVKRLEHERFAVLVSDMRMPEMDGAELLACAKALAPDTTRVLLTGQADLPSAVRAVNDGAIFRFLTKPCGVGELIAVIGAAAEQHRLVTSERVLLEQTLKGAVEALTEVLGLADPEAFGRAARVKRYATQIAAATPEARTWVVELAVMLMHIGYVALPPSVGTRLANGERLDQTDMEALYRVPTVAEHLISPIPRLDDVREILRAQSRPFGLAEQGSMPVEAAIIRIAVDYELLRSQEIATPLALATLQGRGGRYDQRLIETLARVVGEAPRGTVRELKLAALQPGMVFAEDVKTAAGTLLIARGFTVSYALLERLRGLPAGHAREPVRMLVEAEGGSGDEALGDASRAA